eukprot:TRINITY_DN19268_c0_g1_i1.p1 TRINITY_DN19268_c0_g1~~TRINITY_DN19268_c0_g1_i1.p1  ORF type:complete len:102 (-),score=1.11 TRINITY_DN19268_c0_g1_i1:301-564(-)
MAAEYHFFDDSLKNLGLHAKPGETPEDVHHRRQRSADSVWAEKGVLINLQTALTNCYMQEGVNSRQKCKYLAELYLETLQRTPAWRL